MKIISANHVRPVNKKDWLNTGWRVAVLIIVEIGSVILLTQILPEMIGVSMWLPLVGLLVYWLIRFHAHTFCYRCSQCQTFFSLSIGEDFLSIHGFDRQGTWYYVKCPHCHKRNRCRIHAVK